ncbi:MAG TPA: bifunctional UDP-N-acetylglucosamine diphosphorylase/glucosamine-1-phosphate N-acetyltransferase GlmU [Acidobacteriota bacterium]
MQTHVCILAAGQSKRMKSKLSKLLHPLCRKPMIDYALAAVSEFQPLSTTVVVGFQRDQIMNALEGKNVDFVVQEEPLGTAHAVMQFLKQNGGKKGSVLVLNGDTPLIQKELLQRLLSFHQQKHAAISLITADLNHPQGYGRIVRAGDGMLMRIVEEADATEAERAIPEVNAGIYMFEIEMLRELLPLVSTENKQKEYYLPDVIGFALQKNLVVAPMMGNAEEVLGINTRVEMAEAERLLRRRINQQWMLRGVTMHDPDRIYIDAEVQIGTDVVLYPGVWLEGSSMIGSEVAIYPNCRIANSYIDSGCIVYENCSIDQAHVEAGVRIGPFARIRPETHLSRGVRIGNFVEVKKSYIGEGTKANHLSYLGDATIGKNVNVGAGTITCNYDGEKKHPTTIEDGVFIGSDTQLIAPVRIGKDAYVAAGSSITDDVPPGSLAIARGKQVNKPGWVEKKKKPQRHGGTEKK